MQKGDLFALDSKATGMAKLWPLGLDGLAGLSGEESEVGTELRSRPTKGPGGRYGHAPGGEAHGSKAGPEQAQAV